MKKAPRLYRRAHVRATMDPMHRDPRATDALVAEVDQLGVAIARLEFGLAELAVDQYATTALLARVRADGTPQRVTSATGRVPRLALVRGDTRAHDRHRAHPA